MRKAIEVVGVTTLMITALVLGNGMRSNAVASNPAKCVEAEDKCWYDCDTGLPGGPGTVGWCESGDFKWEDGDES